MWPRYFWTAIAIAACRLHDGHSALLPSEMGSSGKLEGGACFEP
jgi:hypothetical protein